MVRPRDWKMIAIEKTVILTASQRRGHATPWRGCMRKHQGWSGDRGSKQKMWIRAFIVVSCRKKMGKAG